MIWRWKVLSTAVLVEVGMKIWTPRRRDERTVVADVYHHRFVFVAVGADADISLRAYGLGGILERLVTTRAIRPSSA